MTTKPESRWGLDAPVSSTGQAYQVRHDAVTLFSCRVNNVTLASFAAMTSTNEGRMVHLEEEYN